MKLILVRHGLAVERDEFIKKNFDDSLRPLTEKGKDKTKQLAKTLLRWEPEIEMLISSPFTRAMQTAEIIAAVYKKKEIHQSAELVPSGPPQAFAQWLKTQTHNNRVLLAVGHEPQLSVFASWCLAGFTSSFIDFKKSGALCLEIESFEDVGPRTAELKWAITPKLFCD